MMYADKAIVSSGTPRKRFNTPNVASFLEEMDDIDRKLLLLLYEDPRMSLQEISKRLEISRQTAHRRLQALAKMGVFKRLKAVVSGEYLGETCVAIWGRSDSSSLDSCLERLGKSEFTWRVEVLGGNSLFVMGGMTRMTDLDRYVRFVRDAAEMPEPTVGIMCYEDGINPFDTEKKESFKKLTPLDLKIIALLRDDARKPVAEIADAIGISAKTVRRHLDEMISGGAMVYDQPWDLTPGEDMFTLVFVKLRSGADKVRVARRLLSKDPVHFNYLRSFSNIPGLLFGLVCCGRMSETHKILRQIAEDVDVLSVTPNLIYDERMYWDADSRSPGVMSHSFERAEKKEARPRLKAG